MPEQVGAQPVPAVGVGGVGGVDSFGGTGGAGGAGGGLDVGVVGGSADEAGEAGEAPGPADSAAVSARVAASLIARSVAEFHRAYELPVRSVPSAQIDAAQVTLRQALIEEEVAELGDAATRGDLIAIADALADIVYVAYGTAHVYGIDLDAVLTEVHASNMTKLGADGRPVRRADGKVLKGPSYRPPDVAAVLAGITEAGPSPAVRD